MEIVSVIGSLKACKHIRNKTLFSKAVSMIKSTFGNPGNTIKSDVF